MNIIVKRTDEVKGDFTSTYSIDKKDIEDKTIQDLLVYISENYDKSLGYYSHSVCNRGICMRCIIRVNGKNTISCTTKVPDVDEIILEPASNREVIRDLVTVDNR